VLKPQNGRGYFVSLHDLKRTKLLRLRSAIFPNHYRSPFCAAIKTPIKIGLQKFGIKKHGFRQIKNTAYIHTGIDKDHAQHRVGHGQEMKN